MKLIGITGGLLGNDLDRMIDQVYTDFADLRAYPTLSHTLEELRRLLSSTMSEILFVEEGDRRVGYLIGERKRLLDGRRTVYVGYLFVEKESRNRGYGSMLLEAIELRAKTVGGKTVMLTTYEDGPAHRWYESRRYMRDLMIVPSQAMVLLTKFV